MEGVLKRVFVRFVWCEQLNPPSNKNSTEDMAKSQKQSNMLVYKIFLRRKEELWGQPVTPRGNKLTPPFLSSTCHMASTHRGHVPKHYLIPSESIIIKYDNSL